MLTCILHIVPQPRQIKSHLLPTASFPVAVVISYIIQKGIFNTELSTSDWTAPSLTMQQLCSLLYSTQSCINADWIPQSRWNYQSLCSNVAMGRFHFSCTPCVTSAAVSIIKKSTTNTVPNKLAVHDVDTPSRRNWLENWLKYSFVCCVEWVWNLVT
jgi:hypothetical protein